MPGPALPPRAVQPPLFFLYGEPRRGVGPRFLHLEALEVRSRPSDWMIRPHSHADLHQLFLITEGGGRMDADGCAAHFAAPGLLLLPAGVIHGFTWRPGTAGQVLTLADAYLRDLLTRAPELSSVFAAPACLAGADAAAMGGHLDQLGRELAWSAPGHAAAIDGRLTMLLVEALRLQRREAQPRQPSPGRQAALVARFREAVEARYRSGASVEAYAADLGVTPSTLRRACAQIAACPPAGIVHDRVFLEAQRMLLYTNLTVSEAAFRLGFKDVAYFTRFFTRRAQQSPRRFRAGRTPG